MKCGDVAVQRNMVTRKYRTLGALALVGAWITIPAGRVLGSSYSVAWLLTALGLLAGASAGWLVQHMLHRPMTRQMLTGAGWAASALLFVGLFRDAVTGPQVLTNLVLIVGCTGALAWGVRLLLAPVADHTLAHESSRNLLVGIKHISHPGDEVAPRAPGRRMTPVSSILHGFTKADLGDEAPKSKGQKAG